VSCRFISILFKHNSYSLTFADQLIVAILDGDVQGIRTIVRSAGVQPSPHSSSSDSKDNLNIKAQLNSNLKNESSSKIRLDSTIWKDVCVSILPLHRAVAGLHFHGRENLVVVTLETLIQLGAGENHNSCWFGVLCYAGQSE
jgi:hypothetical protein